MCAQQSRPWSGTTVGDAGAYSDDNWAEVWRNLLHSQGRFSEYAGRGPIIDSGDPPAVGLEVNADSPASAAVVVSPGAAIVDGVFYQSDADETLSIAANGSGNDRIDTVVLRKSWSAQTVRLIVVSGTPAATPVPPSLTQTADVTWEIPLADVYASNGFANITQADITPRHEWANAADGVYLKDILNNSGVTLETGDVVVWDSSADRAVTVTTTLNDPDCAGVWVGRTDNGAYGRVQRLGIGLVRTSAVIARGNALIVSATSGQAADGGFAFHGALGFLLEASTPGDLALAFIQVMPITNQVATYSYEVAQNTGGPTYTTGAERTVSVNTELMDPYGIGSVAANQVTLLAGRYRFLGLIQANASGGAARRGRLLLHNVTAGARLLKGINTVVDNANNNTVALAGYFEITATSVIEMRVLVNGSSWDSSGSAINAAGETERYTYMEFERLP